MNDGGVSHKKNECHKLYCTKLHCSRAHCGSTPKSYGRKSKNGELTCELTKNSNLVKPTFNKSYFDEIFKLLSQKFRQTNFHISVEGILTKFLI